LTTVLLAPGEKRYDQAPTPGSTFSQALQLHEGWNLVSWNIVPVDNVGEELQMFEILPNNPDHYWFHGWPLGSPPIQVPTGKLYKWDNKDLYYPQWYPQEEWHLDYAYYILMDSSHNWNEFTNRPLQTLATVQIRPDDAWSNDPEFNEYMMRWFFLGYPTIGYMKLASIPNSNYVGMGNPAHFDYEGPFHWLIWNYNQPNQYQASDLKIVRTDDGRYYLPRATSSPTEINPIDQIQVLEPGRGYFLGFYCGPGRTYDFGPWTPNPVWINNSIEPTPTVSHFQFKSNTHWCYPVLIDTVDLTQTPLEPGDELAVFDGDHCVGAVHYNGSFPLLLNSWQDDIATPDITDGYNVGNEMIFKWYDVSENSEAEFILPPSTYGVDDPVTPSHSGFGRGAYGLRSFSYGSQPTLQLPKEFKLGQNYPNPFNAETIIPLELPQRSDIKIELFNVQGQNLGVIFNGVREGGWPKIHYNASKLASGMYFCRATAEGLERGGKYQSVGKMLLLK
jgi:hypothetical protein